MHSLKFNDTKSLLVDAVKNEFAGRIALVSSFGSESAVLLHMIAQINPATTVLFNETGMLFSETLEYQKSLSRELGLTNVRLIRPTLQELGKLDPKNDLHKSDTDGCCSLRKVKPLQRALVPYAAWITGRKRYQTKDRTNLSFREYDDAHRVKINPLADWTREDVQAYLDHFEIPKHPLVKSGFKSIGCSPCTTPIAEGEDFRAGRWRNTEKIECGIHFVDGKPVRTGRIGA